jgi:ArsR family transcriptional regulator
MDHLLQGLKAAGEPTRLRLLAILAHGELTVSELTRIVGQSQPRVSRHLRLLCDAGLLDRYQEGAWVFYRMTEDGLGGRLAETLMDLLPAQDASLARDRERLAELKRSAGEAASAYFERVAARWNEIRSLFVDDSEVEAAMLAATGSEPVGTLVDLGTGTGRILEVFAERAERAVGIDTSHEMLSVARASLDHDGLGHCQVRKGDIYHLDLEPGMADVVTIHHVLHFLDEPAAAVAEASRILRPGGRVIIVDFAPHAIELLRTEHAHRRLGFADEEVALWCEAAGLDAPRVRHLAPGGEGTGERITVTLWTARRAAGAANHHHLEVA